MFTRWLLVSLGFAGISLSQSLTRDFLDDTIIHDVRIDIAPSDWAQLQATYLENTYYHANVASGDQSAANVGIRSRGRGSRSADKPNLDINVNKYVKGLTFAELGFFILKANNQDSSLMHEMVAFKLLRKMGLPAPREAPARVYINGTYLGFYTIVEREDEDFLIRNFGEDVGDLYEWKPNDFYYFEDRGTDPAAYTTFLDPKTNDDPDFQKFVDFVQAVNHSTDADFVNAVSQYVDLKLYLTETATENAMGELDGVWADTYGTNNIYLYRFNGQNIFQFIGWDKDLAFIQSGRTAFQATDKNVLARRLLAIPEYNAFYLAQLSKAITLMGGAGGWADTEVSRIYDLIHNDALNDPHKQCLRDDGSVGPCTTDTFDQGVQAMREFLATRQGVVQAQLADLKFQPPTGGPTVDSVTFESVTGGSVLVPGSLARVHGIKFNADFAGGGAGNLPRWVDRSFVAVGGVRAPIVSMSNSEAIVQIPWDLMPGSFPVAVASSGEFSNTQDVQVVEAAPVIQAIVHGDGSPVTIDRPAVLGEILAIYATGLGPVDTGVQLGIPAPSDKLIHTADTPTLQIGSEQVSILFSGLAPGFVGLYQINVQIPTSLSQADSTLTLSTNGQEVSQYLPIN